jgi:hypothetical protein
VISVKVNVAGTSSILPNFFLRKIGIIPFSAIKLWYFIENTLFYYTSNYYRLRKLKDKNGKIKKNEVW